MSWSGSARTFKNNRRMSSYLKKVVGQGTSRSQKAGSARTSKKKIMGQGTSWSQEAGSAYLKKHLWGRVRAGPRRQDQFVTPPQQKFGRGTS